MDGGLVGREDRDHADEGEGQEEGGGRAEEGVPEAPVDAAAGAEITLDGLVTEGLGAVLDLFQDGLPDRVKVQE